MSRPNLLRQPITKEDIQEYLASADDFQLEIDVFRACLQAGLSAEHGGTYKDPNTKVDRQFDVRARYQSDSCFVRFAIECKALADFFPLIVSRVPRRKSESGYKGILAAQGIGGVLYSFKSMPKGLFPEGAPVGKATCQLGRRTQANQKPSLYTGDAEVYEKWSQAIASAYDLVRESINGWQKPGTRYVLSSIIPVLIVSDKSLWCVDYSENGSVDGEPSQVDECSIFLNTEMTVLGISGPVTYPVSHLMVYTKTGFMRMLDSLVNKGDTSENFVYPSDFVEDMAYQQFGDTIRRRKESF